MDVYVLGMAVHPPAERVSGKRLEEMVFDTSRAALDDAGVDRAEVDHVTIAACDDLDGRTISSMLLAAPAGALLRDETKCTDSGLTGLCLGAMRIAAGTVDLGLVVSWSKTSEAPVENVMRWRCEPFYTRPIGLNMRVADALFAGAVSHRYHLDEARANACVIDRCSQARRNPRGMERRVPSEPEVATSRYLATPLRAAHCAPITDGAVAMVLASEGWLARSGGRRAKARIAGMGWRSEPYDLGAERLAALAGFRGALGDALQRAGGLALSDVDVLELDTQTVFHHLTFEAVLFPRGRPVLSPSGGAFAQNPYFCAGLVNAVEAVHQLTGAAGPIQIPGARRAIAHQSHGFAQQGNVAVLLETST